MITNGHFIHFLKIFRFVNSPNVDSVKPVKIWLSLVVADGANRLAKRGGRFGRRCSLSRKKCQLMASELCPGQVGRGIRSRQPPLV